jgi:hypothetical protein
MAEDEALGLRYNKLNYWYQRSGRPLFSVLFVSFFAVARWIPHFPQQEVS